jgi:hypothetical protein
MLSRSVSMPTSLRSEGMAPTTSTVINHESVLCFLLFKKLRTLLLCKSIFSLRLDSFIREDGLKQLF